MSMSLDPGDAQTVGELLVERLNEEIEDTDARESERAYYGREHARELFEELSSDLDAAGFEIVRKR